MLLLSISPSIDHHAHQMLQELHGYQNCDFVIDPVLYKVPGIDCKSNQCGSL